MICVLASISVKAGKRPEFLDIFKANVPNVLAEKGCMEYTPMIDAASGLAPQQLDEHLVTIVEKWESLEDLKAHLSAPHMETYRQQSKDLVEKVTLKVLQEA